MLAVRHQHLSAYQALAAAGADLFPLTDDGQTALLLAAACDSPVRIQQALAKTPTLKPRMCQQTLETVAVLGRATALQYLLTLALFRDHINRPDAFGWTAAMRAARNGELNCLQLLVAADASLVAASRSGKTILHITAQEGHADVLQWLLEISELTPTLDRRDFDGCTPLACAIKGGSIECVEILQDAGCNIRSCELEGRGMVLCSAARHGHAAVLVYLLSLHLFDEQIHTPTREGYTPWMWAVTSGSIHCCQILQDAGASPLIRTNSGDTALHVVEKDEMLGYLLEIDGLRRSIDQVNDQGESAVLVAVDAESEACVQRLLSAGADPNVPDSNGWTSVHHAAKLLEPRILQLLIQAGKAGLDSPSLRGETPLMRAARTGRTDCVRVLLDAGADPSLQDQTGSTALHRAAAGCCLPVLQLLLQASICEINLQDSTGHSPLMVASTSENLQDRDAHMETMKLLLQFGALVDLKNEMGLTAKELVRKPALVHIFQVLQDHEDYLATLGHLTKPALRAPPISLDLHTESPAIVQGSAWLIFEDAEEWRRVSALDAIEIPVESSAPSPEVTHPESAPSAPILALFEPDEELTLLLTDRQDGKFGEPHPDHTAAEDKQED
eukprot:m.77700 g.77700  ORF g.77700 m.77700 type:complete len:615 (+) comp50522_c0_seq1:99-1943(+)